MGNGVFQSHTIGHTSPAVAGVEMWLPLFKVGLGNLKTYIMLAGITSIVE